MYSISLKTKKINGGFMKRLSESQNLICILGIPVLFFIASRLNVFINNAFGIDITAIGTYLCFGALFFCFFLFRKKIAEYLEAGAYGFSPHAITIYILSCLTVWKYSNVFISSCAIGGIVPVIGAGLLLGAFVLQNMKTSERLLVSASRCGYGKKDFLLIIVILVLLNLQAVLYCRFMKTIFVWDNAGYFTTVHKLNDIFPSVEYFREVYRSVFETDYNYIIMLPASIMCRIFGKSRLVFILSIINFYVFPLLLLIQVVAKKYTGCGFKAVFSVLLCLPYIIFAANTGFIDIGGTFFALAAFIIFVKSDSESSCLLSGVLLAICVLLRRWYSFYALAFIIAGFDYGITNKRISGAIHTLFGFAFTLLFFAQDFVTSKLMADYKGMYAAYALGIKTDFLLFFRYFGIIPVLAFSAYAIYAQLCRKRKTSMSAEMLALLIAVLCFVIFTSVQTHGQQHLALYVPSWCVILISASGMIKNKKAVPVFMLLCAVPFANTLVMRVQPKSIGEIKSPALIPNYSYYPPIDENTDVILELTDYLDEEIGLKGKTACLVASSLRLNYDTLMNAEISLSVKPKHEIQRISYIKTIPEVDRRDGFTETLFETDYIITTDKAELHLAPEEQKSISIPNSLILSGTGFGAAYEKKDKSFAFPDGTQILIYKRTREITPEEKQEVLQKISG